MARKPSFDFERRERTKEKAAKRADKLKTKQDKRKEEAAVAIVDAGDSTVP